MIEFDMAQLRAIGLSQYIVQQLAGLTPEDRKLALMRVVEVQRDLLRLHDGVETHTARILPPLRHALEEVGEDVAVGDWVVAELRTYDELWIAARMTPQTHLARRDNEGRLQSLVSNVDTALLVMGLDHDFNPRRLERYLALVVGADIAPVVVLTKSDGCADVDARLDEVRPLLPAGVPVFAVNGLDAHSADALLPWLGAAQTLVLLGSSGAGKSTLANTLSGSALQLTGEVRGADGRGRHTTTARTLIRCAGGACIIDTPGLRTLRLDGDPEQITSAFEDIEALAAECRFRDCRHVDEPGCAVRGAVPDARLRNYHKLLREAERGTWTALERKQQAARWKQLGKAGLARAKEKRGG
jgi:ribosome biogenesis GTPase